MQGNHTHICLNCATPFTPTQKKDTAKFCSHRCYLMHQSGGWLDNPDCLERLMERIDDSGGPDSCWPWTGPVSASKGYGMTKWKGVTRYASRAVYMAINGDIPRSTHVRHKCDNPICCNPAHLEPGTRADNMRDMVERGRHWDSSGERNPKARLSWNDVRRIRRMYADGMRGKRQQDVADEYGVTQKTISSILRGASWREG